MKFSTAIDTFLADMRAYGRINSAGTETAYRQVLDAHAHDIANRDPRLTNRDDVKQTLERWPHPNTRRARHAALTSFYDWAMEEGLRKDNPARQVRRPRKQPTSVYRLTRVEAAAMLLASMPVERERWAIHLGICAGLRSRELRGLTYDCFLRPGWIHVPATIAKRKHERWMPVTPDLEPIVTEILARLQPGQHVLCGSKAGGGAHGSPDYWRDDRHRSMSSQTLQKIVHRIAAQAGIRAHVHPHLMRHAYGDHVAKYAGMRNAQALLGHADVSTTQTYVGQPSLEELAAALKGFTFNDTRTGVPSPLPIGASSESGEGGIRTLESGVPANDGPRLETTEQIWPGGPTVGEWLAPLDPRIQLYVEAFSK